MNIKEIQDLIKFVAKAGVTEVEIEQKDFKITIKTTQEVERQIMVQAAVPAPQVAAAPVATPSLPATPVQEAVAPAEVENQNLITVKSPMIGTFYRAPGPDKEPF